MAPRVSMDMQIVYSTKNSLQGEFFVDKNIVFEVVEQDYLSVPLSRITKSARASTPCADQVFATPPRQRTNTSGFAPAARR